MVASSLGAIVEYVIEQSRYQTPNAVVYVPRMNATRGEPEPRPISAYISIMPQAEQIFDVQKILSQTPRDTALTFVAQAPHFVFSTNTSPQRHPPGSLPTSPGEENSPRQSCRSHPSTQLSKPLPPILFRNRPRWPSRRVIRGRRRITTRAGCGEFGRIIIRIIRTARRDGGGGRWRRFLRRSLGIGGRSIMYAPVRNVCFGYNTNR